MIKKLDFSGPNIMHLLIWGTTYLQRQLSSEIEPSFVKKITIGDNLFGDLFHGKELEIWEGTFLLIKDIEHLSDPLSLVNSLSFYQFIKNLDLPTKGLRFHKWKVLTSLPNFEKLTQKDFKGIDSFDKFKLSKTLVCSLNLDRTLITNLKEKEYQTILFSRVHDRIIKETLLKQKAFKTLGFHGCNPDKNLLLTLLDNPDLAWLGLVKVPGAEEFYLTLTPEQKKKVLIPDLSDKEEDKFFDVSCYDAMSIHTLFKFFDKYL